MICWFASATQRVICFDQSACQCSFVKLQGQPIHWSALRSLHFSVVFRTGDLSYASAESPLRRPFVVGIMAEAIAAGELGGTRRPIIVTRMNGDELSVDIDVNATVWQIMTVIKQSWNVSKYCQVLSAGGAILPRRQALPAGVSRLWLVCREQRCAQCNLERRKGKLCSLAVLRSILLQRHGPRATLAISSASLPGNQPIRVGNDLL